MKNPITRRDFLNGSLVTLGALGFPAVAWAESLHPFAPNELYPPRLTGMRGSHPGAFEAAHKLAMAGDESWKQAKPCADPEYDLVVVGGGISGLAAARFFQLQHGLDKKILILENHDDFGGHARRNEFVVGGKVRMTYGGSQSMDQPGEYSDITQSLLDDLGVRLDRFDQAYDLDYFKRHDLRGFTFFNQKVFGKDRLVDFCFNDFSSELPGILSSRLSLEQALAQMPLAEAGKAQLLRLFQNRDKALDKVAYLKRFHYIKNTGYFDFLRQQHGVTDPLVFKLLRALSVADWGLGADVMSVMEAVASGSPGLDPLDIPIYGKELKQAIDDPGQAYIHHFPDGNASIARALVLKLMPTVAKASSIEESLLARFDYSRLDRPESAVRLRLNSTVMNVHQEENGKGVKVTYVQSGAALQVKAKHCILACYNMMIPHLLPTLPEKQKAALKSNVKMPMIYTSVMLNHWQAFFDQQIGAVYSPGNMHQTLLMDYPVSFPGHKPAPSPKQPQAITLIHIPLAEQLGMPPKQQFRQGRYQLLSTSFEAIEQEIKEHLGGILSATDFDPERDINAITVNRWSHGYAYSGTQLFDGDMETNAKIGRQPFGPISIANSDAGASAYMDSAIDQAWRAVEELDV